jgi:hypothetical protein
MISPGLNTPGKKRRRIRSTHEKTVAFMAMPRARDAVATRKMPGACESCEWKTDVLKKRTHADHLIEHGVFKS